MWHIKSGYGTNTLPLWAVFNLYVIFICTSIPGLAISPIMGDLTKIFPGTSQLETQFLEIGPNIAAIPFVFIGGWIGTRFNNSKLTTWTCLVYGICGVLFFFVPNMICLIALSFLIGIFAGILSPLSSAFIADMFYGEKRTAQYGYTSATLNIVLMLSVIATGYLAKISWRLPFMIYLLPFIPLFFAKGFAKYITNPSDIRKNDAKALSTPKVHYKFSHEVNIPMLVRYCIFYFTITFVIAGIGLYIPFRYTNSAVAGDLTSVMYFGIAISGYTLNWCVRVLRKKVAIWSMIFIGIGFLIMTITSDMWLVGFGILLATYFYGIGQPYYYDRLSIASSRIALTLTLAWFASMDSIANVVAAPITDVIAKIFHSSTSTHPIVAFKIFTVLLAAGIIVVFIRKIIVSGKDHFEKEEEKHEASTHPMAEGVDEPKPAKVAVAAVSAPQVSLAVTTREGNNGNGLAPHAAYQPIGESPADDAKEADIAAAKAEFASKAAQEAAQAAEEAAEEAKKYAGAADRAVTDAAKSVAEAATDAAKDITSKITDTTETDDPTKKS